MLIGHIRGWKRNKLAGWVKILLDEIYGDNHVGKELIIVDDSTHPQVTKVFLIYLLIWFGLIAMTIFVVWYTGINIIPEWVIWVIIILLYGLTITASIIFSKKTKKIYKDYCKNFKV